MSLILWFENVTLPSIFIQICMHYYYVLCQVMANMMKMMIIIFMKWIMMIIMLNRGLMIAMVVRGKIKLTMPMQEV